MERVRLDKRDDSPSEDHVVMLGGVTWADYERLLDIRGDHSAPRMTYLEGTLEIMSPSRSHEAIKSLIGSLLEAHCLDQGIELMAYGSWTIKDRLEKRGAEPDECYVFGGKDERKRPHLAIEVEWTAGRIDKLDVYRKLGVLEVWYWTRGRIQPYRLRGQRYVAVTRSKLLPDLDLDLLARFLDRATLNEAIRGFRAAQKRARGRAR